MGFLARLFGLNGRKPNPVRTEPARRTMWQTAAMPVTRAQLAIERRFSAAEYERISVGLVPEVMEDKWFIFLEADRLFFHRGWTGFCIFEVAFAPESDGSYRLAEAWANRDREQYRSTDAEYDAVLLTYLIDRLLLGRDARFPLPPNLPLEKRALYAHAQVGYGRSRIDIKS